MGKGKWLARWLGLVVISNLFVFVCLGCTAEPEVTKKITSNHAVIPPSNLDHSLPAPALIVEQLTPLSVELPVNKSPKQKVKGIYVSAWSAVGSKFEQLLDLVDQTDLNAMVIDVKNDSGQVTYSSAIPMVNEIGANSHVIISDLKAKLIKLKEKGIYTIARVVVFKDPYLSKKKSKYAMMTRTGQIWKDAKGTAWVDPYKEEVWDYNIQIAKEVADLGFEEIQFDYVRFPENGNNLNREVDFDNPKQMSKSQVIEGFLRKANERLGGQAYLSADVFGLTTSSDNDMGIGQDWSKISKQVHYISPMLYPSHYSSGIYGVKNPDLQPYAIISKAIADAVTKNNRLKQSSGEIAEIRPWYQDFTATWVKPHKIYGKEDVQEQIKAAKEQGVEQFLIWNSSSTYSYR
ncbi:putative glycoside hydrolase [Paenibacillus sp. SI8]|uniref:putative glycoside hydrolase n=1 Tax=unclassified Paenibacillus TaxID=185978 RepID=UPI00346789E1